MHADTAGRSAFPWLVATGLALPAFLLAAGGGLLGPATPVGGALVGAGVLYLIVELLVIQPRFEARALSPGSGAAAAQDFLEKGLAVTSVDDVAAEFGRAIQRAIGPTRALLLAPGADGEVRVLIGSGDRPHTAIGDATPAFLWLGDREQPVTRAELAELQQFDGARATAALMDAMGCNLLLPLLHRGLLLGVGLVQLPDGDALDPGFWAAMRAYMTVAVANTFLDAEARGRSRLTRSFDLATAMQESLMPDDRPVRRERFEVRGIFRPVAECGGDLWVWRELADNRVLLVIADATGHGAAPALLAAVAKGAIDAHWQMALKNLDPGNLLRALNTAVHRTGRKRYMMTAFAAVIDTSTGELRYANAGQNFPYLVRLEGERARVEPLIARGNSLGATADAQFETKAQTMRDGDKLLLYTDGVIDAGTPQREPWGEKRFRALLAANVGERAHRLPDVIMGELERYTAGAPLMDDITMAVFQLGAEAKAS
ncbi:MAG TPA: PP2C family protein-serine/threonine phosphatase [Kofleriaceae bacterium]|nr:PP2C family protein-serine/threonine phosphatase [Kofleriaceae bacterium]